MKKIFFLAAVATAALMTSCGKGGPSASLSNDIDTLSYELGVALAPQDAELKAYLQQMGSDSTQIDEFLKGMREGLAASEDKGKMAYYQGIQAGLNIKMQTISGLESHVFGQDSTKKLSLKNIIAGIYDSRAKKTKLKLNGQPATREMAQEDLNRRVEEITKKEYAAKYADNRKKSDEFMAKIAKTPGVKAVGNGVYYKVIKEGAGAMPKATDTVSVVYEGKLTDGNIFDSSQGQVVKMPMQGLIKGFSSALAKMPAGSTWEIYIPYNMGYGEMGQGPILPYSSLIFTVSLK